MAMNLESAAMTALQSGVDPYSSKSYLDWMSSVPEAQTQLPGAIKRQRERQVSELESGIPEKIRTAAQPLARRGLHGSGLQLEDIGQAALDRQIAIDRAKTLAEIDPIQAQIALQDLARTRAVQRGGEERRRFEREESITESQRARDQLMKTALSQAAIGLLGGTNPLSSAIFGGKGQEGLLQKAIGGIGSLFGGGTPKPGEVGGGYYLGTKSPLEDPTFGQTIPSGDIPPPLFGTGMIREDMENVYGTDTDTSPYGTGYDPSIVPDTATDQFNQQFLPTQEQMLEEGGGMYGGTSPYRDITTYEGEQQFPMISEQPVYPSQDPTFGAVPSGAGGQRTILEQLQEAQRKASIAPSADTGFSDYPLMGGPTDLESLISTSDLSDTDIADMDFDYTDQATFAPTDQNIDDYFLEGFTAGMLEEEGGTTYGGGVMDYMLTPEEFPKMLGGGNTVPFGKTSGLSSTGRLEEMQKAMEKGFQAAQGRTFENPLDDPNTTAMLATDAIMKDAPVTEGETDILGTLGSLAKLPFQALGAGMEAVGGAKKAVGDLTTKVLDTATGGAYSGIRGLGGQAAKAVSDALGGVVSPSTVGSAALTALRGKEGLKSIAKDPLGFAGKKILSSSLPSLKSTVGALSKGSLPSMASTPFGVSQIAANAAYDAALAQGLSVQAADKAALAASNTAMTPLGASVVGIPMLAMSIGQQQAKKSRAKEAIEYTRNLAGSAPHNLIPGELWMAGNRRTSPVLEESNTNFRVTDQLTGMDRIFLEDPRRSVMGGDSLSKRGQDFAKENNINYKHSDPDVQNMSQKWLGKQQVYSELIPELKPIFQAGLKGEISRQQAEDAIAQVSNSFFEANPIISQIHYLNQKISEMEEANKTEADSFVEDKIMALKEQGNKLKEKVPSAWKKVPGLMPEVFEVEFIEDEQE